MTLKCDKMETATNEGLLSIDTFTVCLVFMMIFNGGKLEICGQRLKIGVNLLNIFILLHISKDWRNQMNVEEIDC